MQMLALASSSLISLAARRLFTSRLTSLLVYLLLVQATTLDKYRSACGATIHTSSSIESPLGEGENRVVGDGGNLPFDASSLSSKRNPSAPQVAANAAVSPSSMAATMTTQNLFKEYLARGLYTCTSKYVQTITRLHTLIKVVRWRGVVDISLVMIDREKTKICGFLSYSNFFLYNYEMFYAGLFG